jgi:site-specific DNA-methyltransferase (adenine-specific)/site-specific DNA-methyltransferase (cytosine-N4-specific)
MGGDMAQCSFTSPPYAEQREYDKSSGFVPIPPDKYPEWYYGIARNILDLLTDDGNMLINIKEGAQDGARLLYVKHLVIGLASMAIYKDEIVWRKGGVPGKWLDRLRNDWEPVFHFAKGVKCYFNPSSMAHESEDALSYVPSSGKTYGGNIGIGNRRDGVHKGLALPGNVVDISTRCNINENDHPAAFPVKLAEFFLNIFSATGSIIAEPFGGSGTTLIAAAKTGRVCRAMEISPRYCDVIRRRWTKFAKENGVNPGSGALE